MKRLMKYGVLFFMEEILKPLNTIDGQCQPELCGD